MTCSVRKGREVSLFKARPVTRVADRVASFSESLFPRETFEGPAKHEPVVGVGDPALAPVLEERKHVALQIYHLRFDSPRARKLNKYGDCVMAETATTAHHALWPLGLPQVVERQAEAPR